ncbi:MAG: DUF3734 domain-containing protein [Alphaproteobacteria bacterium]|nr:DUF3734 domain-containing protein [Alphaproteobacteria bacterium]
MPSRTKKADNKKHSFECVALLLQGGGALGAYQGGVYQALAEHGIEPDWVAGISIGAINAAIIAGNAPDARVDKLRAFWESVTTPYSWLHPTAHMFADGKMRGFVNQISAGASLVHGVANFFTPRMPTPWLHQPGTPAATSYYDTKALRSTLESLIDFDRINAGEMRFNVGAVNVRTGNFTCFDAQTHKIGPDHIMASGALPPGFPAVEIDGEHYWDGGLVSNTPLQWMVECMPRQDTLAFQVDLWSARGAVPRDMAKVMTRQKEIRFSSRTRANTDRFRESQRLRHAAATLLEKLPSDLKQTPEAELLQAVADCKTYNIAHLIYHTKDYEGDSKDYEFSRLSMEDHWRAGYEDARHTLSYPEIFERPANPEGISVFDFSRGERKDTHKPAARTGTEKAR